MSTIPPGATTPNVPVPQKSSGNKVLLWVIGIIVGLFVLGLGTCGVIGFYAMHKVKQAGFDSELMKKNPGLATAKMAVAMNPDVEVVSSDDRAGSIKVRDKKTGKVTTMKFDPEKKSMVIVDENGQTSTITANGEGSSGTVEVNGPQGTVKIGGNADKAPAWVPQYPGSSPQGTFSSSNANEQSGSFTFTTADPVEKLIAFYGDGLKSGGFTVSNMTTNSEGKAGGMVSGEDKDNKRTVMVMLSTENDGTHANVTFSVKQ
ncbi:MAG: hypothetical protein ACRD3Q_10540 [Terriglobales bacterium]